MLRLFIQSVKLVYTFVKSMPTWQKVLLVVAILLLPDWSIYLTLLWMARRKLKRLAAKQGGNRD